MGGRLYEHVNDGTEHDWGQVTLWDPPVRLGYSWHIGGAPAEATDVEIEFVAAGDGTTVVRIEHRGSERLDDRATTWRARNEHGWATLLPHLAAVARSTAEERA